MATKRKKSASGNGGGSNKGGFTYRSRNKEQISKRANQTGGGFDSIIKDKYNTFNPKEGDHRVRILPPTWDDAEHFGHDIYVHFGIGPDNQSYLCHEKMRGEQDPIDEERRRAQNDGDSEYAKELSAKQRVAVWVIDRDNEEEGPMVWSMPWTVDRDIADLMCDRRTGEIFEIDNPEEGYDVDIKRHGSGKQTRYTVQIARRATPLHDDPEVMEEWLNYILDNPIPETFNFYDYDHIDLVFSGGTASKKDAPEDKEEEDDEEEDGPPWDEDPKDSEEDEEDEEDEEEEDDDEEDRSSSSDARKRLSNLKSRRGRK